MADAGDQMAETRGQVDAFQEPCRARPDLPEVGQDLVPLHQAHRLPGLGVQDGVELPVEVVHQLLQRRRQLPAVERETRGLGPGQLDRPLPQSPHRLPPRVEQRPGFPRSLPFQPQQPHHHRRGMSSRQHLPHRHQPPVEHLGRRVPLPPRPPGLHLLPLERPVRRLQPIRRRAQPAGGLHLDRREVRHVLELPEGRKSLYIRRLVDLYQRDYQLEEGLKWIDEWKRLSPGSTTPWHTRSLQVCATAYSPVSALSRTQ